MATRQAPSDAAIDPFVVLGTLGLALLFRKTGLDSRLDPFRCPSCGKPVSAHTVAAATHRSDTSPGPLKGTGAPQKSAREYVDDLARLGADVGKAQQHYTQKVRYGILLYYGSQVTAHVDTLVAAGNAARAVKLLNVARPFRWPRAQRFVRFLLLPVLLDIAATAAVVVGAVMYSFTGATTQWPSTEGTVLASGIDTIRGDDGRTYRPTARYRYVVAEQPYEADRVSYKYGTMDLEEATALVERFTSGSVVPVYYDRGYPTRSVLVPGASWFAVMLMIAGGIFLLSSGLSIALAVRRPLRELRELDEMARAASA
jgi:hypothetical protein